LGAGSNFIIPVICCAQEPVQWWTPRAHLHPDDAHAGYPGGRVGKNPGLKKNQRRGVFGFFGFFLGFFGFFGFFAFFWVYFI
jgi:hypothetical protein